MTCSCSLSFFLGFLPLSIDDDGLNDTGHIVWTLANQCPLYNHEVMYAVEHEEQPIVDQCSIEFASTEGVQKDGFEVEEAERAEWQCVASLQQSASG